MELVYLWVEDYKNIHKQGFNFSPRFDCEYDDETKELTIDENEDYIENFFGDNINVTAIVGKNGSGKSSIIRFLEDADYFVGSAFSDEKDLNFIICIKVDEKINIITTIASLSYQNQEQIQYVKHQNEFDNQDSDYLFYSYCAFLTLNSEFPNERESKKDLFLRNKTISYKSSHIANLAIKNSQENYTFQLTTFMRYPKRIFLYNNTKYAKYLIDNIQPPVAVYSNNPKNGGPFPSCYHDIIELGTNNPLEAYMLNKIVKVELCEELFRSYSTTNIEHSSVDNTKALQNFYDTKEYELNEEEYDLYEYEQLISRVIYNINDIDSNTRSLIEKYDKFFKYDFEDDKGRKFLDLSHGEKSLYAQFVSMYDTVKNSQIPILIALDEPDFSLHPTWQKKYLNEFMTTFIHMNKNIHIILTSHSPFLLSDIPKQNIIFLDKDKNGNCLVLKDGLKEKKQTFGANIHTLLSDSFFMEDGLMGEFAKKKIQEIMDYLNDKKTIDEISTKEEQIKQVIESIGELFLKEKLLKMYDEKYPKTKEEKIAELQKQIEALKDD